MPSDERDPIAQLRRYADAIDRAAAAGTALVTSVAPARFRWSPRVGLATAIVALLTVAGLGLVLRDDAAPDREVTASEGEPPDQQSSQTIAGGRGCVMDVRPGPDHIVAGPPEAGPFDPSQPSSAHVSTGDGLIAEINVPGYVLTDLTGETVEPVTLELGPAHLWHADAFTQLRRFDGRLPECSSFTVTVRGGTAARRKAVALAIGERIRPRLLDANVDADPFAPIDGANGCTVDVLPGSQLFTSGPGPAHLGRLSEEQPASAHLVTDLGELVEIHVPGFEVRDLLGEDTEQITIDLGPATLWRSSPTSDVTFTQLRFWDGHENCGGFAVTVYGQPDSARRESVARVVANRLRPRGSGPLLVDPSATPSSTTTSSPAPATTLAPLPATELHLTIDDTGTYEVAVGATITVSLHREEGIGAPSAHPDGILERTASDEELGGTDSNGTFRAVAPGEVTLVAGPACGPEPRVDERGDPIYCLAVAYWLAKVVVVA